jgi:hypothetical protein
MGEDGMAVGSGSLHDLEVFGGRITDRGPVNRGPPMPASSSTHSTDRFMSMTSGTLM